MYEIHYHTAKLKMYKIIYFDKTWEFIILQGKENCPIDFDKTA